jgi:hypothetical protein
MARKVERIFESIRWHVHPTNMTQSELKDEISKLDQLRYWLEKRATEVDDQCCNLMMEEDWEKEQKMEKEKEKAHRIASARLVRSLP